MLWVRHSVKVRLILYADTAQGLVSGLPKISISRIMSSSPEMLAIRIRPVSLKG